MESRQKSSFDHGFWSLVVLRFAWSELASSCDLSTRPRWNSLKTTGRRHYL